MPDESGPETIRRKIYLEGLGLLVAEGKTPEEAMRKLHEAIQNAALKKQAELKIQREREAIEKRVRAMPMSETGDLSGLLNMDFLNLFG